MGVVQTQTATLFAPPDALRLECGRSLGPIEVAYETYGALSPARDNAVFVCHALTGDAHAAGYHAAAEQRPGWWEFMIGPGKPIDTRRYFVICANILGGCRGTTGPSSINPQTQQPWGLDFPIVTVADMVKVHKRLTEHLGISKLLAVVGGSMGGMQVLEWAVRYPDSVRAAIAIATTPRLSAQSIAFDAIGRSAILADPKFAKGLYHAGETPAQGLAIARMIGHITYLSEEGMHAKFGRQLRHADRYRFDFTSEFSVETYLDHQGRAFVERFDANSYLYVTKAMDYFDLPAAAGSLEAALAGVKARFLVISFRTDWLFTPAQSRQIVDALLARDKDVTYCNIDSHYGHDAFLLEPERLGRLIHGHLESVLHDSSIAGLCLADRTAAPPRAPKRLDLACIEDLIAPQSTVLDLGCGDGTLLARLRQHKGVRGFGVETDEEAVLACVDRGLPVIHGDLEDELAKLPDDAYDCVVLSQTLQALRNPNAVLHDMLRVGRVCLVSFPNAAYWRRRLRLLVTGRAAYGENGSLPWHASALQRSLSLRDFLTYCRMQHIRAVRVLALNPRTGRRVQKVPNARARQIVVMLQKAPPPSAGPQK